jgi:hypothetical protein
MVRAIAVMAGLAIALPAVAGEMTAAEARQFVVGKSFSTPALMAREGWLESTMTAQSRASSKFEAQG